MKRHQRRLLLLFIAAASCLFTPQAWAAPHDRVVYVGIYENPPKVFTDNYGRAAGIFIDILAHIAASEGWSLLYVPGTWQEGLARLERGEIDLMPDVAHTAERDRRFDFHKEPVLFSWSQVYTARESGIKSILDLAGKRVAVLDRSVQQEAFARFSAGFGLDVRIISVPELKDVFAMVTRGEADAAVSSRFYGHMHAGKFGLEDSAIIFDPSTLFFAAPEGKNANLLAAIDRRLAEMKKDHRSVYYESLKRWTAEGVRFALPAWLKVVGASLMLLVILGAGGTILLKHQVDARTRELRLLNEEMEQRIVLRTEELAAAMEKAREADRLKSAFLATMSHELRTPLNSIIGFTGILLQGLAGPLNDEQRRQLTMVQTSGRHLLNLISDVLDISKIEAGKLTLAREAVNLRGIIEKVVESVRPQAEAKKIGLSAQIAPEIGTFWGDGRRIEQVLLNLLANAIKFTEKGLVKVECDADESGVTLKVSDTGIGIRPEDMKMIFESFPQIDAGIRRRYEGTGLGLSITKKLVELMGGVIKAESEWGKGSTFTVTLPYGGQNHEI